MGVSCERKLRAGPRTAWAVPFLDQPCLLWHKPASSAMQTIHSAAQCSTDVLSSRQQCETIDPTATSLSGRLRSYFASCGTSCPDFDTGFPGLPENGRLSCSASLLVSDVDRLIGPLLSTAETMARTSAG